MCERNMDWLPLAHNLAHNPGMCPDWESNQQPFGSQAGTQSTEPHQPGLKFNIFDPVNSSISLISKKNMLLGRLILYDIENI